MMDVHKKAIEAIVHPLVASERRKNTLREELWAHFCALLEEELQHEPDRTTAANTALRRIGDPDELRAAFMASLSKSERWLARLDPRPDEAPAQYVRRVAWIVVPSLALVPICFGIQCALVAPRHAIVPWAIMLTLSMWLPMYLLLALRKILAWQSLLRRHRSIAPFFQSFLCHAVSTAALAASCVIAGFGCLAAWKGSGDDETLAYLYMAPPVMAFVWFALTLVGAYALVRETQHAQIIADWPYANLSGPPPM